jgi:hypothetical protein
MLIRLLAAMTAVLFIAGCAGNQTAGSGAAPASPSTVPSSAAAGGTTLSGTIEEGVEPGCLLLKGDGSPHLLFFADPAMKKQAKAGASVTVIGVAKPGQMTTCQQGIPFLVNSISVD